MLSCVRERERARTHISVIINLYIVLIFLYTYKFLSISLFFFFFIVKRKGHIKSKKLKFIFVLKHPICLSREVCGGEEGLVIICHLEDNINKEINHSIILPIDFNNFDFSFSLNNIVPNLN